MNPDKQRIAIAEACGWKRIDGVPDEYDNFAWWNPDGEISRSRHLPDYLNDLNAMHEAEKVLTRNQRVKFVNELCSIVGLSWRPTSHFDTIHTTAAQRAEAFLRTVGKWEDSV